MSDFLKIFLFISAIASAFLFGRNHGEKIYRESMEFKEFVKAREDLNYAKNEFENAKAKLQNIVDSADSKRTEELLSQILQVFLVDLGLRIQNRDIILQQAKVMPTPALSLPPPTVTAEAPVQDYKKKDPPAWSDSSLSRFKSFEWMLENSEGKRDTFRSLEKLRLKSIKQADGVTSNSITECQSFLGSYRGDVQDIFRKRFGSLVFEFRSSTVDGKAGYYGSINWFNVANNNSMYQKVENNCGKKITGLSGRIFDLAANKFIHVYKLSKQEKLAGNFYEVLPNKTTNFLGAFVLGRTDIFP